MKRLCELIDVAINNGNCVVFKVKDDTVMDLISLGCFKGTEDMIRMTKGRTPEITVFNKDGSNYSYHFGEGSSTVISDNMKQQREMIRECAILNFGIICDLSHMTYNVSDEEMIGSTVGFECLKQDSRAVSLVSGGGMSGHIRVNEQTMVHDINVKDVAQWFKERGYKVSFPYDISHGLPCGTVRGFCEPVFMDEKEFDINNINKERFSVLLGNAISFLSNDFDNDKLFYDFLCDEIGMSDEEIELIGCGAYIPKGFDGVLMSAKEKSEGINCKDDEICLDREFEKE